MGRIQEFCVNAPKLQNRRFFSENTFVLAKGYNHICSASPTKKVTSRGRGARVKNKIQGAGPFFDRILADDLQRLAPQEKKSHLQANHPQIGHDGTNSRILCQRAQIAKQAFFF